MAAESSGHGREGSERGSGGGWRDSGPAQLCPARTGRDRPRHASPMGEKRILCVGLVCLDIISVVERYPPEDSDSRCLSQRWQRGGNASNTCTVLALLGAPCAFMGSLAPGQAADFVRDDFQHYKVDLTHLVMHPACALPTSVVISNSTNGTRTILHAARFILSDFKHHGVDVTHLVWQTQGETPCACCLVNCANGSRTVTLYDTKVFLDAFHFCKTQRGFFRGQLGFWQPPNAESQICDLLF